MTTPKPAEERTAERLVLVALVLFVVAGGVARVLWPGAALPAPASNVALHLPAGDAYFPVAPTWTAGPTVEGPTETWTTRTDPATGDILTLTLFMSPSFTATVAASPCAGRWTPPLVDRDRYYGVWPAAHCVTAEPKDAGAAIVPSVRGTAFVYWIPDRLMAVGIYFRGRNRDVPRHIETFHVLWLP